MTIVSLVQVKHAPSESGLHSFLSLDMSWERRWDTSGMLVSRGDESNVNN